MALLVAVFSTVRFREFSL
uniref:Uncharacterized protein n=1 Tax=Arundo donax TaxID=35708 RepID=A0A0A8YU11_ARUDO